ncbi:uncharacterized protein [Dermacentor albipictus]|uniref:uncharacterized protein n=1 Tax=Dermacentor albipictus TaxID=60249 RepID=UPI0031FCAC9E
MHGPWKYIYNADERKVKESGAQGSTLRLVPKGSLDKRCCNSAGGFIDGSTGHSSVTFRHRLDENRKVTFRAQQAFRAQQWQWTARSIASHLLPRDGPEDGGHKKDRRILDSSLFGHSSGSGRHAASLLTYLLCHCCRFGFPETVVSDNGSLLFSEQFQVYLEQRSIRHLRTAPYHASSNGLAERFDQTLKAVFRKTNRRIATAELADFWLAYRNTSHATTGEAPSTLLLGRRLRTRLDQVRPSVENKVSQRQFHQTRRHPRREKIFGVGDDVRVGNFRLGPKWLCATVLARTEPVSYRLSVVTPPGAFQWVRHQNHILKDNTNTTEFNLPFVRSHQESPVQVPAADSSTGNDRAAIIQREPMAPLNSANEHRYSQRQRHPPERCVP